MSDQAKFSARGVAKSFHDDRTGRSVVAIEHLDIEIQDGEFVVLIGPSGCGKSTFLYMCAGFEHPSAGEIRFEGQPVTKPGPERGIVFQDFVLYPWRTVLRNITVGLELQGMSRRAAADRARHWIDLVGLDGFAEAYPRQLSGGMKQRVAIARTLACEPAAVLMDEPFGALDMQTRDFMVRDLERIWGETGQTIVFVTHSVDEALALADRIIVFGARPSQVKADIPVRAERPRELEAPELVSARGRIKALLQEEVGSALQEEMTVGQ